MPRWSLARLLPVAALVLPLSACSTGPASTTRTPALPAPADADAFPVTIKHVFGETTIEKRRPASPPSPGSTTTLPSPWASSRSASPRTSGADNDQGSTPWKDAALEELGAPSARDKAPVQFSEADGINFTEIAKLTPDVILAAYSGLTEEDYKKLTEIAPVVAHPEIAYGTSWQDSTAIIGKALGKEAEATKLISDTEATIKDKVAKYPQIAGKSFIYGNLEPANG